MERERSRALVERYAKAFERRGGHIIRADAIALRERSIGWEARLDGGILHARHVVVALGPWSDSLIKPLGYRLPLFVKRGYHRHYIGEMACSFRPWTPNVAT